MDTGNANDLPWWKKTVAYQIYTRSFADANGDGIGDLPGIISKLDYLRDLGVETLWLTPFFGSPQRDFGYDVSDYRAVAPEYGSVHDADRLISEVHARGMKVIFDLVLNHTSDRHPWFLKSRSSRHNPKRDWYIWRDGRKPGGKAPPNNWWSMVGGSGWHYDPATDQWYWAQFLPFQPDLNYRNPEVVSAMLDTMRFWMSKGVDGFRLDIVNALFEDAGFRDNPLALTLLPSDEDPRMFFHDSTHTLNHPDTIAFMRTLRQTIDTFDNRPRFLIGETNASIDMARAHCDDGHGLNLVFLFRTLAMPLEADCVRGLLRVFERTFPEPLLPTWVFSNHDRVRRIGRLGNDPRKAALNMALQLTARGVPFLYYGEEIGMTPVPMPVRSSKDALAGRFRRLPQILFDAVRFLTHESVNRDESRTPMQWSREPNAGFCPHGVEPWLPVGEDSHARCVAAQEHNPASLLNGYKRFLAARRETPALHSGDLELMDPKATGRNVVGFVRTAKARGRQQRTVVLLNCSEKPQQLSHPDPKASVLVSTEIYPPTEKGDSLNLRPWEALVLLRQDA